MLAGAVILYQLTRPARRVDPTATLRDTLHVLRSAADSCRSEIDESASRLQAFDARLDSLRSRVREYEAIDPRGVPADSYEVYLEAFDRYNESVPGWSERADTLRERWARCTDLTQTHNALADSLRQLLLLQMEDRLRERRSR